MWGGREWVNLSNFIGKAIIQFLLNPYNLVTFEGAYVQENDLGSSTIGHFCLCFLVFTFLSPSPSSSYEEELNQLITFQFGVREI